MSYVLIDHQIEETDHQTLFMPKPQQPSLKMPIKQPPSVQMKINLKSDTKITKPPKKESPPPTNLITIQTYHNETSMVPNQLNGNKLSKRASITRYNQQMAPDSRLSFDSIISCAINETSGRAQQS